MELTNLTYLGLTKGEITVFSALLEHGPQSVADLISRSKLKKGDCYNKLADLKEKGLIEEFTQDKKKHYRLANPKTLETIANSRYQDATVAKRELEGLLPEIMSTYTLTYHQPGISIFEGSEAMHRIPDDSITATDDILQYVDLETVLGGYQELNAVYARLRKKYKKRKRMIVSDSPVARAYATKQDPTLTEVRLVPYQLPKFATIMMIYNNKVSYLTLKPEVMIGVIIEDTSITQMHRALFEMNWQQAHTLPELDGSHQILGQAGS